MAVIQTLSGFSETSLYILSMSLIHTRWSKCLLFNPVIFTDHLCQAGKLLELPRLSLAWLLQNYCNLSGDKQFQLADWRIRLDIFFCLPRCYVLPTGPCQRLCSNMRDRIPDIYLTSTPGLFTLPPMHCNVVSSLHAHHPG